MFFAVFYCFLQCNNVVLFPSKKIRDQNWVVTLLFSYKDITKQVKNRQRLCSTEAPCASFSATTYGWIRHWLIVRMDRLAMSTCTVFHVFARVLWSLKRYMSEFRRGDSLLVKRYNKARNNNWRRKWGTNRCYVFDKSATSQFSGNGDLWIVPLFGNVYLWMHSHSLRSSRMDLIACRLA